MSISALAGPLYAVGALLSVALSVVALRLRFYDWRYAGTARGRFVGGRRVFTHSVILALNLAYFAGFLDIYALTILPYITSLTTGNDLLARDKLLRMPPDTTER